MPGTHPETLAAAIAFFIGLGLELEGETTVEGPWVMFAVDDIDAVLARRRAHGAELVGDVAQYEDVDSSC